MEVDLQVILAVIGSVVASSGFWAWMLRKTEAKSATTQLMMGLAYIELTTLGRNYIHRGSITWEEYEDYRKYFYEPYKALGGNGIAERIMADVSNLPLKSAYAGVYEIRHDNEETLRNVRIHGENTSSGRP